MAARRPVIASNISFFKEMAKRYGSLIVVENDEDFPLAIKKAMEPKNYKKMLKECERYIRENSLIQISKKYQELYSNLLNQ